MTRNISRRTALALTGAATLGITGLAVPMRPARAADSIKIGAALSLTGRFSDSAKYVREGYELWAEQLNKSGGIGGKQVELVIYDDESNPDTARVLAERLIDRDKVTLVLGPYSSPITDAMATVMERSQVPMLGTIASDTSIWDRRKLKWTFQAFPSSNFDHEGFLNILKDKAPGAKLAIVYEEAPFSIGAKNWAMTKAKELGFTAEAYGYNPGNQDFRSIIERIVGSGATYVSMGGYYQPSIALTRQMVERGFNPAGYHFIQASDGVTKDALGANAEGIFGRSSWEPGENTAGNSAFVEAYKAKFNRTPSYHSAAAYSTGQVYEAAMKAKGVDRAALRDFIASTKVPTITGTFGVDEAGRQTGYRYIMIQWQNGQSKIVGGGSSTPIVWPKPAWK